jgi:hypothetical protein
MGEYRTRFLLHKFSLKTTITVHRGIITSVYNEFYTLQCLYAETQFWP